MRSLRRLGCGGSRSHGLWTLGLLLAGVVASGLASAEMAAEAPMPSSEVAESTSLVGELPFDPRVGPGAARLVPAEQIRAEIESQLVAGVVRPHLPLDIRFHFDSADLTESGRLQLDQAGRILAHHWRDRRWVIGGHTDSIGDPDYNLALSRRRAEAVRSYLIERHAIAPDLLEARGFGESEPLAGAEAARNRRVVFEMQRSLAAAN